MNSLSDISMDRCYATLCGITQQELESHFAQPIDKLASYRPETNIPVRFQEKTPFKQVELRLLFNKLKR